MINQDDTFITLNLSMLPDGSLTPDKRGIAEAVVQFNQDDQGVKTAKIFFGGLIQAHATYNMGGDKIVSYSLFTQDGLNPSTASSVENIVEYLNR